MMGLYALAGISAGAVAFIVWVNIMLAKQKRMERDIIRAREEAEMQAMLVEQNMAEKIAVKTAKIEQAGRQKEAQKNSDLGIKNSFDKDTF